MKIVTFIQLIERFSDFFDKPLKSGALLRYENFEIDISPMTKKQAWHIRKDIDIPTTNIRELEDDTFLANLLGRLIDRYIDFFVETESRIYRVKLLL